MNEPPVHTSPFIRILDSCGTGAQKVLVIKSGCKEFVSWIIDTLHKWKPELAISLFCHEGEEISGLENIIYPDPNYFRLGFVDLAELRRSRFDLVVVPYSTNRRLHPEYYELDIIATTIRAESVIACYLDRTAVILDQELLKLKADSVVKPYLEQRYKAIEEICAFTGEDQVTVENKCDMAGKIAGCLWLAKAPRTEEEIIDFYGENDFYIYQLMKENDWRGARSDLAETIIAESNPQDRVCDYGGGCGALSIALAQAGFRTVHLDLPGRLLDFAAFRFRQRDLDVQVIPATGKYPLEGSFDGIICTHVLEHLTDPEEKLSHMAGHLEAGGKIFLAVPFEPNQASGTHPGMHLNRLSYERYREIINELGFRLARKEGELDIFVRVKR